MPSAADINELIANTEEVSRETIHSDEIDRDINKITLRSKINGKEITFLTNGYMNGTTLGNPAYLYYMSASRTSSAVSMFPFIIMLLPPSILCLSPPQAWLPGYLLPRRVCF